MRGTFLRGKQKEYTRGLWFGLLPDRNFLMVPKPQIYPVYNKCIVSKTFYNAGVFIYKRFCLTANNDAVSCSQKIISC